MLTKVICSTNFWSDKLSTLVVLLQPQPIIPISIYSSRRTCDLDKKRPDEITRRIKGYALGHFGDNSSHIVLDSIHPSPGKKSERQSTSAKQKNKYQVNRLCIEVRKYFHRAKSQTQIYAVRGEKSQTQIYAVRSEKSQTQIPFTHLYTKENKFDSRKLI